jgi:hypothetical protein
VDYWEGRKDSKEKGKENFKMSPSLKRFLFLFCLVSLLTFFRCSCGIYT